MIVMVKRVKHHMLMRKKRGLGTTLTLLIENRVVVVIVEARPKPLINRRIFDKLIRIL
jgi:hypothetical protein